MPTNNIEIHEKKELRDRAETTYSCKVYTPQVDICEKEDHLLLVADLPGVTREDVQLHLDNQVLTLEGKIRPERYEGLTPRSVEYNVGHFRREFTLGADIDQEKISAAMADGVLRLTLPKVEKAKPRRIEIR